MEQTIAMMTFVIVGKKFFETFIFVSADKVFIRKLIWKCAFPVKKCRREFWIPYKVLCTSLPDPEVWLWSFTTICMALHF